MVRVEGGAGVSGRLWVEVASAIWHRGTLGVRSDVRFCGGPGGLSVVVGGGGGALDVVGLWLGLLGEEVCEEGH